jgi:hypothetical protein
VTATNKTLGTDSTHLDRHVSWHPSIRVSLQETNDKKEKTGPSALDKATPGYVAKNDAVIQP